MALPKKPDLERKGACAKDVHDWYEEARRRLDLERLERGGRMTQAEYDRRLGRILEMWRGMLAAVGYENGIPD